MNKVAPNILVDPIAYLEGALESVTAAMVHLEAEVSRLSWEITKLEIAFSNNNCQQQTLDREDKQ